MIIVDKEGIEAAVAELSRDVGGMYCESRMYIGRLRSGKVVQMVVMTKEFAEENGFDGDHAGLIES